MLIFGVGEDQDIDQVDKNILVEHVSEHVINQGLEHGWGVGEGESRHQIFIMSCGSVEGCLPLIPLPDLDQMVGVAKIHLGENSRNLEQLKCA